MATLLQLAGVSYEKAFPAGAANKVSAGFLYLPGGFRIWRGESMNMQKATLGLILIMALALSFDTTGGKEGKQPLDTSPRVIDKNKNCSFCSMRR